MYSCVLSVTDHSAPWLISTLITNRHYAVSLLMPRKKNPSPIRKQYSRDLKKHIVYQAFTLEKTTTEISIDLDIPLRVVQRVLKCWREIGEVCKDRTRMGHAPLMKPDGVKFMLALLDRNPDIYLDEIQEQLGDQHGMEISLAMIWRTLKRLGITSKKLSKAAAERCAEARRRQHSHFISRERLVSAGIEGEKKH